MLKAFDWSKVAWAHIAWFSGVLVLTLFWPDFSQQSLISSKDKSRDDLQQNLQISVNAISVLLSNENYTSNELNALLIGEGGLIQDWFKDNNFLSGWILLVKCVGWVGTQKVFERNISSWNENKSPQSKLCLGHDLSHQVKSKFIQIFLLCKGGCVFPMLILPDFCMSKKTSHFTGKTHLNNPNSTRNIIGS